MNHIIELENINKKYGNKIIFENLNMEIDENCFVAIVGKSGYGKSTLLNILGLVDKEYLGKYTLFGQNVSKIKDNKRAEIKNGQMGFVYQNYNLIEELNALDNICLPICYSPKCFDKNEKTYINKLMELLNIEKMKKQKVKYLSGGEKQRIAIARAMVLNPSIILADEPTGNLDAQNRDVIFNFFKESKKNGKSIIVVTHDTSKLNEFDNVIDLSELRKN